VKIFIKQYVNIYQILKKLILNLIYKQEVVPMKNQSKNKISLLTFAAMMFAIFGFVSMAQSSTSPFAKNDVTQIIKGDGDAEKKCGEGKFGYDKAEKKCGEGKCGDDKAEKKCGEGKCGDDKADHKCGDDAKSEEKCGDKAESEEKCGDAEESDDSEEKCGDADESDESDDSEKKCG